MLSAKVDLSVQQLREIARYMFFAWNSTTVLENVQIFKFFVKDKFI